MCFEGFSLAQLAERVVSEHLREGRLIEVRADWQPASAPAIRQFADLGEAPFLLAQKHRFTSTLNRCELSVSPGHHAGECSAMAIAEVINSGAVEPPVQSCSWPSNEGAAAAIR